MKNEELPLITVQTVNEIITTGTTSPYLFILGSDNIARPVLSPHPCRFGAMLMVLCLRGTASIWVNLRSYDLSAGSFIIIPPNMIVDFPARSEDIDAIVCGISQEMFEGVRVQKIFPLMREIMEYPLISLDEGKVAAFRDTLEFIKRKKKTIGNRCHADMMRSLLLGLLYEVASFYTAETSAPAPMPSQAETVMKKLRDLVMVHYRTERKVEFYAEKLCLTPKYLSSIVKKTSGKTVSEWIRTALVMDAQIQLKNSELTIQQISDLLMFPNPSFFGRFFKKHTGMTPMEYRQS